MNTAVTQHNANELTPEQVQKLESDDQFLRGTAALDILNDAVKKTGIVIPPSYVFKKRDREMVETAMDAVFELKGGVPSMLLWAVANETEFYKAWMKRASGVEGTTGGGSVMVVTQVGDSPLDSVTLNKSGFVNAQVTEADDDI